MNGPSEHLSWAELACHDAVRTPYPIDYRQKRLPILCQAFEAVRKVAGGPITILSAYRTPTFNASVGGAVDSQHVQGRALDLSPPDGMSVDELYGIVRDSVPSTLIRGVGRYGMFVHMDVRPGALVTWDLR